MIFSFGGSSHERIEIDVLGYERAPVGDFHDDNWLAVKIKAGAGGFIGVADAAILTSELNKFLTELRPLYDSLRGTAEFTTLEGQIQLRLTGNGMGQLELIGELANHPSSSNRLHFALKFDQSQLNSSICQLENVVSKFPIR